MKTKAKKQSQLKMIVGFFRKIFIAIVSGLPRERFFIKPEKKVAKQTKNESFKMSSEKHYHHQIAKPVVEKQTLLKEKKKQKLDKSNN